MLFLHYLGLFMLRIMFFYIFILSIYLCIWIEYNILNVYLMSFLHLKTFRPKFKIYAFESNKTFSIHSDYTVLT